MLFDKNTFGKLPVVFQAMLGFVLFAFGAWMVLFSGDWSIGDIRLLSLFLAVGVLYLVTGLPPLIEGVMTMFREDKKP